MHDMQLHSPTRPSVDAQCGHEMNSAGLELHSIGIRDEYQSIIPQSMHHAQLVKYMHQTSTGLWVRGGGAGPDNTLIFAYDLLLWL